MKPLREPVEYTLAETPETVYLPELPPRITAMILALLRHKDIICRYDTGGISLHWNGPQLKPQLEKIALNSSAP